MKALLILAIGIVAAALSFVFIRESVEPSVMLAAWRVLLAALLLLPLYVMDRRRYGDSDFSSVLRRSLIPGSILSLHFIAWVVGARLTPGANATLMVNLMPLVMPFLMFAMYQERLDRRDIIATLLALSGLLILGISDVQISSEHLLGDLICLLSMLLFALYLALARRQKSLPSVWLYVVPMYAVAGIVSLIIAPLFGPVVPQFEAYNLLMVFCLAAVSTVVGHSALNYAMQQLPGQTVTIMNLFQFVVAGIVAWWLYDEVPAQAFYLACVLVVSGMVVIITRRRA